MYIKLLSLSLLAALRGKKIGLWIRENISATGGNLKFSPRIILIYLFIIYSKNNIKMLKKKREREKKEKKKRTNNNTGK